MKNTFSFFIGLLCLFVNEISIAQTQSSCAQCNMTIEDIQFKATVESNSGETLEFDAIECLMNYLKTREEDTFRKIMVSDYLKKKLISAKTGFYLKSKVIVSPMGANLAAFDKREHAVSIQNVSGGEVYNWTELKRYFLESNSKANAHQHHNSPGAYAPGGVMGDHLHPKGGLMVSLRYMNMNMAGNREGDNTISDDTVYESYMVAPQNMDMQMYMLGVMYAPSDKVTIFMMQNFVRNDMELTMRMMNNGMNMFNTFSTSSSGLGDLKIGLLHQVYSGTKNSFHLNTRFNVPMGKIDSRDDTPMMENAKLPYAMQLGSGTFDIGLGGTLKGHGNKIAWGLQQLFTFRTGTNSQGYRFGNTYEAHLWGATPLSQKVSLSLRLSGSSAGDIKGVDADLNPMMVTTADPENYGGDVFRMAVGCNFLTAGNRFLLGGELTAPVYQNYNGIFMNEEVGFNMSAKYTLL